MQPGAKGAAVSNSEVKDKVANSHRGRRRTGLWHCGRLAEEQAVLLTDINAKLLGDAVAKLAANGATVAMAQIKCVVDAAQQPKSERRGE